MSDISLDCFTAGDILSHRKTRCLLSIDAVFFLVLLIPENIYVNYRFPHVRCPFVDAPTETEFIALPLTPMKIPVPNSMLSNPLVQSVTTIDSDVRTSHECRGIRSEEYS
jgi:hypothetical protein